MARIVRIAKYIEVPAPSDFARLPRRRAPARPPALYLLELRSSVQPQFTPRRLTIAVAAPGDADARPVSVPVKISEH